MFTDLAVAATQYGTIEHCAAKGPYTRVALNFTDPNAVNKAWDVFTLHARMDVETGSDAARIVGSIAVLVSTPRPAVVLYDAAGTVISRTPGDTPAADIAETDRSIRITPANTDDTARRSLIDSHLLSVSVSATDTPPPAATAAGGDRPVCPPCTRR